jgi:hypothetical protein
MASPPAVPEASTMPTLPMRSSGIADAGSARSGAERSVRARSR